MRVSAGAIRSRTAATARRKRPALDAGACAGAVAGTEAASGTSAWGSTGRGSSERSGRVFRRTSGRSRRRSLSSRRTMSGCGTEGVSCLGTRTSGTCGCGGAGTPGAAVTGSGCAGGSGEPGSAETRPDPGGSGLAWLASRCTLAGLATSGVAAGGSSGAGPGDGGAAGAGVRDRRNGPISSTAPRMTGAGAAGALAEGENDGGPCCRSGTAAPSAKGTPSGSAPPNIQPVAKSLNSGYTTAVSSTDAGRGTRAACGAMLRPRASRVDASSSGGR